MLRAALFDFDGVLVDTEPLHYRALRAALAPEGIVIEEEEYLRSYLAYDDREAIRIALERHGSPHDLERIHAVATRKAALFEEETRGVSFFPGARELVQALVQEVPLAIVSGALRAEIEAILRAGNLADAFNAVVGAEDTRHGKPHPEPYLRGMTCLLSRIPTLRPEECLAFEDSMPGIASAQAAGMKVVGVAHSYPAAKLHAAHLVVESLSEVRLSDLKALFPGC